MKTFFEWLLKQIGRDDPIGDFADDTRRKGKESGNLLPINSNEYRDWLRYLKDIRVHQDVIKAFREAWDEYSKQDI